MIAKTPVTGKLEAIVLLCLLTCTVAFRHQLAESGRVAAATACLTSLVSLTVIFGARRRPAISMGLIYAALFALFHCGLLVPIAFGQPPELLGATDASWLQGPSASDAALTAAIAQLVLCLTYLLGTMIFGTTPRVESASPANQSDGPGLVGGGLLLIGVSLWYLNVAKTGTSIIGVSYATFLQNTGPTSMPMAYLLMGFGMGAVAASNSKRLRGGSLALFVLFAIPGFLIGLRGEVIVPLASYLVVAARRRRMRLRWWAPVIPVVALSLGSAVRVVRQHGLGSGGLSLSDFNPVEGILELGYSIRPLIAVHVWHDVQGEPFVGIATYVAPFRRVILGRVLGLPTTPIGHDSSVLTTVVSTRIGPIGGSPAAEAYRAGGLVGVLIVLGIIGILLARLDSLSCTSVVSAVVGMASAALFLWVRNDFTPAFVEIALILAASMAMRQLDIELRRLRRTRQLLQGST